MQQITTNVRILSYNMFGVPFVGTNKKERFDTFVNEVIPQDLYDVYCFQEVFSSRRGFILRYVIFVIYLVIELISCIFNSERIRKAAEWFNNYIGTGADLIEGRLWMLLSLLLYPVFHYPSIYNPFYINNHPDKVKFIRACNKQWGKAYFVHLNLPISPLRFMDGGLLVVSKFPLKKVGQVSYSGLLAEDQFAGKGALFVSVKVPTNEGYVKFILGTTHLQSGYGEGPKMDLRHSQMVQISNYINGTRKYKKLLCELPCIITGDWNICRLRESGHYTQILNVLNSLTPKKLEDVFLAFDPHSCTSDNHVVDYMLSNVNCTSCKMVDYHVSDHSGIEGVFTL